MGRWFRMYADAMRHPKVAKLSDKDFRLWVKLLSVASENEGLIHPLGDLKHVISMRLDHLSSSVDRLITHGLIDRLGFGYEPHNWKKKQFISDTSTPRVSKHRQKRNVSETPPDTDTDTDTDTERKEPKKVLSKESEILKIQKNQFEAFWMIYPRRVAKGAADKAWKAATKKTSPDEIIAAAQLFAAQQLGNDPQYIAHPATWLNAERWKDDPQSLVKNQHSGNTNARTSKPSRKDEISEAADRIRERLGID